MRIQLQTLNIKLSVFLKAIILGFFFISPTYAQDLKKDIKIVEEEYISKTFNTQDELKILSQLSSEISDPDKILEYSNLLIDKAKLVDSTRYLFDGYLQKGNAYSLKRELSKALEFYQMASTIAADNNEIVDLALTNITIGGVYSDIGNHDISTNYYEGGISQLRQLSKTSTDTLEIKKLEGYLATALLNAGDEYFKAGNYDKALSYFYESSGLCEKTDYRLGAAYNLGNIGMVYAKQKKPNMAEANLKEAIKILEEEEYYRPISYYLNTLSEINLDLNQPQSALDYATRSLELAIEYENREVISKSNLQLSRIYEQNNEPVKSLFHYKNYIANEESINDIATVQKLANLRTEFQVSQKQIELDLERQKRKNDKILTYAFLGGMILVSGIAFGLYRRNKFINKTKKIIDEEKKKSERLLLNILPKETADELKTHGKVEAKRHESVTVLFTDFKSFTKYAENSSPEKLVESVDMYFSEFDKIMEKYKIEKIKTIGDSYMCAAGLHEQIDNHAELMAEAALDIIEFVRKSKQVYAVSDLRFDIRIGMHTGPVVAGVVGKYKFSYDIWGDTVNVASRIESSCETGKICISEDTYQLIKDKYEFVNRGKISIKNRSPLNMYYLSRK